MGLRAVILKMELLGGLLTLNKYVQIYTLRYYIKTSQADYEQDISQVLKIFFKDVLQFTTVQIQQFQTTGEGNNIENRHQTKHTTHSHCGTLPPIITIHSKQSYTFQKLKVCTVILNWCCLHPPIPDSIFRSGSLINFLSGG